jgi:hypothetical protein
LVIQKRTRQEIRQSVGYNLGAMETGTAYDAGSTTTLISLTLVGSDDNYNGRWLVVADVTDSNNTETRIISDYTSSAYRLTLQQALSFATAAGDTFEIWDRQYNPTAINEFINQAILDVTGQVYDPIESDDLHADGKTARFDAPSNFSMVNKIQYRSKVSFTSIHQCSAAFDESVGSGMTVALDTEDFKSGKSCKFTIADGASAGVLTTDSIASKDLSSHDYIEFWIKSTVATSAGNLKILLDDTANCAAPTVNGEVLSVPALSADTWTFCRVALSNPEDDTAIISVGLEMDADLGACVVWLDDIKAVANDTATWTDVPNHLWSIDKVAKDIVFTRDGVQLTGYHLLKLTGGDKPALLTTETATCEVDDGYVINKATALALSAASGGPATDPDAKRQQAAFYYGMSEQNKRAFPFLINVRTIS